jgi:hypothetical protein
MDILNQVKQHANRSVEETIMSGVPLHPKWFQMVADEIERLREELEDMHRRERSTAVQNLGNEGQLCDEIERLREALKFYANPYGKCECVPDFYSELGFGDTAENALNSVVKESLSTCKQSLQVQKWKCPIGVSDCRENCGNYGCGN